MSQTEAGYQTSSGSQHAQTEAQQLLHTFWPRTNEEIKVLNASDFKQQELPLARIKKIMKLDEDVKMISAEAPVLFAKAAEIFVTELSLRAWIHTEDNKRRTLQRNDIAMAITKFDQFDFLIDIVPRDELKPQKRQEEVVRTTNVIPDQVQYYFQLAQQHQAALQQQSPTQIQILQPGGQTQTVNVAQTGGLPVQTIAPTTLQVQATSNDGQQSVQVSQGVNPTQAQAIQVQASAGGQPQLIQLQQPPTVTSPVAQQAQQGGIQLIQQIVTSNGEVQHIPIQLTPAQVQLLRMQMQGQGTNQPIIIQAASSPLPVTTAGQLQQPATTTQVTKNKLISSFRSSYNIKICEQNVKTANK
ncbi:hypothetical protein CHUAL_004818 [Chamberlinius hualienensis]